VPDPLLILKAAAAAGVFAALVVLLAGWPWRQPHAGRLTAGAALAAASGLFAGAWLLDLAPAVPPRESTDRLFWILLPAVLVVEVAAGLLLSLSWLALVLRLAVAAGAAPILLYGSIYTSHAAGPGTREWLPEQMALILGGLAVALLLVWLFQDRLAARGAGRGVLLALALAAAGAGVTNMLSGYATGGQLGFPLAAALLAIAAAALVLGPDADLRGAVGVGVVALFSLLLIGRFFGSLTTIHAVLLFFAPLLGCLVELPFLYRLTGPWPRAVIRLALAAVPVVVVLVLARQNFIAATQPALSLPGSKEASVDDYMNFGK
jgi:hypothetical protein